VTDTDTQFANCAGVGDAVVDGVAVRLVHFVVVTDVEGDIAADVVMVDVFEAVAVRDGDLDQDTLPEAVCVAVVVNVLDSDAEKVDDTVAESDSEVV
jgi:hypothetical protein